MKTDSGTQSDKASTSGASRKNTGMKSSLAALMARLASLNRRHQDAEIEYLKKPAKPASNPTTVLDEDLLERTDFFACLLRNWTPRD